MAIPERHDEALAEEILSGLREDVPGAPADLPDKTIRRIRALLTTRDLIDLTTLVFIGHFCAPLIDLIAALFGAELPPPKEHSTGPSPEDSTPEKE